MFKAKIIKNNQQVQFCLFETEALALKWKQDLSENKSWGKPAGFYPISQLSQDELAQEISRKTVNADGNQLLEPLVEIPAQFEVVIEDITAQVEAEKTKEKAKKDARVLRITNLKAINWAQVNSIAEIKEIVKHLVDENLKDEQ